jgi:hypothetical protein
LFAETVVAKVGGVDYGNAASLAEENFIKKQFSKVFLCRK